MDVRLTWTDCEEAGDYVVPNVLSPRDLVSKPDSMEETVLHVWYTSLAMSSAPSTDTGPWLQMVDALFRPSNTLLT